MKFNTTYNSRYITGIGEVSKNWIEYNSDSHETCIKKYFHEEIYHWDYDCAGYETHDFLFEDGKAYRLEYNYWSEWYREDEENGLKHAYRIFEIKSDDAKVPSRKPRDWILP